MNRLPRLSRCLSLVALALSLVGGMFSVAPRPAAALATAGILYGVTDLGTPPLEPGDDPADNLIFPEAINDAGQIVGRVSIADLVYRAFFYENGQIRALPGVATLSAINASGQAAGSSPTTIGAGGVTPGVGLRYEAGRATSLGTLPGTDNSFPRGINDAGQIVGGSGDFPFIYRDGAMRELALLPGDCSGMATGINNRGEIAGRSNSCTAPFGSRPVRYDAAGIHDLGLPGGVGSAYAVAINDRGDLVVNSAGGVYGRAFVYSDGRYAEIDPGDRYGLEARAINGVGQVVGVHGAASGLYREGGAFIFSGGQFFDLDAFIPPDSGWRLFEAFGINNRGQIVGVGEHDGVSRAFLLTPRFADLAPDNPNRAAILALADRGIVQGYADGRFGPDDPALRAQSAALIARASGWDGEDWADQIFPDQGAVDNDLWRNVRTLAHHEVALGYQDGTYNPTGPVARQQAVLFITRALLARGLWIELPDTAPYPNLPNTTARERADRRAVATYVFYAGALPEQPIGQDWPAWNQPASRGLFAQLLWAALRATP